MVARVIPVEPFDLVVFGGTGDLAQRKILPGLYRRFRDGQMPPEARIIAAARREMAPEAFRALAAAAIEEHVAAGRRDSASVGAFLDRLAYVAVDADGDAG